ncbi:MAG: sensor histidine kinase, partial [Candidatus Nanopelagicaceae bacterium]
IIQPFVENSIEHGFSGVDYPGNIVIKFATENKELLIEIKDNGKGFDPQQNTTGFGLQGVRERVTALAGYLQMSSDFDCGCTITVNIPRKQLLIL